MAFAGDKPADTNVSVQAFIDICVKQAPTFSGSVEAAAKYGITELDDTGDGKMGFTPDKSLAVQIKENDTCTVTTDTQADKQLTTKLLDAVAAETGQKPGKRVPAPLRLGEQLFALMHDREGGEAFVLHKVSH